MQVTIDFFLFPGTTEAAWKGVTMEAERVCEVHLRVKERLLNDVVSEVKRWQKDNFHRNMMQQLKQKREMDDAFKKVKSISYQRSMCTVEMSSHSKIYGMTRK